ncbi:MAG TPA: pilus assembly protein TadG-related protein [Chloroflexota bacterium]|nr:pilus assembly protein TadG-related protein [Chloroflexota bacterium]
MPRAAGYRQRAQTFVFAAVAMVAMVGGLAIVIDGGMFFLIQRQFQTAADAGALAGAWHDPICPGNALYSPPCIASPAAPTPVGTVVGTPPNCVSPPSPVGANPSCVDCPGTPGFPACDVALANAKTVSQLCIGPIRAIVATGTTLIKPARVNTIVVTVKCDAGYTFGRILNLSSRTLWASAAAALGNRSANNSPLCNTNPPLSNGGDISNLTPFASAPCGYIARLIE